MTEFFAVEEADSAEFVGILGPPPLKGRLVATEVAADSAWFLAILGIPPPIEGEFVAAEEVSDRVRIRSAGVYGWQDVGNVMQVAIGHLWPPLDELDDNFRWYIGPPEMRFAWTANVGHPQLTWFRAASGQAGVDPHLRIGIPEDTQCLLNRWKPAHTFLAMDFSSLAFGGPMQGTP